MDPVLLMTLIKGGMGLGQMISGRNQAKNNPRTDYEIPQEIKTLLQLTQRRANESLIPGQGMYENQIDRNAASGVQTARSVATNPAQLLEAATSINANSNNSLENLALMGVQNKNRNVGDYTQALRLMGQYKDKQFDYNEAQKYKENAGNASSLLGAGMQNLYGAIDGYGSNMLLNQQQDKTAALLKALQTGSGGETMTESLNAPMDQQSLPDNGFNLQQLDDLIKSWGQNGFGDTGVTMQNFG